VRRRVEGLRSGFEGVQNRFVRVRNHSAWVGRHFACVETRFTCVRNRVARAGRGLEWPRRCGAGDFPGRCGVRRESERKNRRGRSPDVQSTWARADVVGVARVGGLGGFASTSSPPLTLRTKVR
jgi:hypothetical protein